MEFSGLLNGVNRAEQVKGARTCAAMGSQLPRGLRSHGNLDTCAVTFVTSWRKSAATRTSVLSISPTHELPPISAIAWPISYV